MDAKLHLERPFERRHVGDLLQPEAFVLEAVDGDGGVADQPEFRFPDCQVVHRIFVPRSDKAGVLFLKRKYSG